MMIDFKDACLKEKKKCMCEVFKKKSVHVCGQGKNAMKWCLMRKTWKVQGKAKGNEKSSREKMRRCLTSEWATFLLGFYIFCLREMHFLFKLMQH